MCYSEVSRKFFIIAKIYDKKGMLLSTGYNSYIRTDPNFNRVARSLNLDVKEYIHAEFAAIKKLKFADIPRAYKMNIYRFGNNGKPANAKPCPICRAIIKSQGIEKINYTTDTNSLDMDFEEYNWLRDNARFWIRR